MIELHGKIATYKCFDYGHPAEHQVHSSNELPPHCKFCGSLLRPDILWFGEKLQEDVYDRAEQDSFNTEVFISIGSSLEVYPAASLPLSASRNGAYLIQINPKITMIDRSADYNLRGKAGEIMPLLWEAVWRE